MQSKPILVSLTITTLKKKGFRINDHHMCANSIRLSSDSRNRHSSVWCTVMWVPQTNWAFIHVPNSLHKALSDFSSGLQARKNWQRKPDKIYLVNSGEGNPGPPIK